MTPSNAPDNSETTDCSVSTGPRFGIHRKESQSNASAVAQLDRVARSHSTRSMSQNGEFLALKFTNLEGGLPFPLIPRNSLDISVDEAAGEGPQAEHAGL
jgi:hypothetical protein